MSVDQRNRAAAIRTGIFPLDCFAIRLIVQGVSNRFSQDGFVRVVHLRDGAAVQEINILRRDKGHRQYQKCKASKCRYYFHAFESQGVPGG